MSHANLSVFVPHIGCPNRCSFCDQHTISGSRCAPTPQQVQQLCTQAMQQRSGQLNNTQLAFFGGSFTAIEREYMLSLLQAAQPFLGKDGFAGSASPPDRMRWTSRCSTVCNSMESMPSSWVRRA